MQPKLLTQQLPTFLARLRKTDKLTITSDSVSVQVTEEPPHPVASDTATRSSAFVKKYEIGSGENRVNVRIYKEPPANKL